MRIQMRILALVIGAGALAGGCKKEEAAKNEPAQAAAKVEETAQPATDKEAPKAASADFVATIMTPYEECRALLADDKGDGVADCANAMSAAAKAAAAGAPDGAKGALTSLTSAADALAAAGSEDIEKARMLYGDVSKEVVALLTAVPEAAKDYHVFECPMAKGYKRWAQADSKLANPYMGTKMLECGSEVHDHHKGMSADQTMDEGHGGMHDGHKTDGDHNGMH